MNLTPLPSPSIVAQGVVFFKMFSKNRGYFGQIVKIEVVNDPDTGKDEECCVVYYPVDNETEDLTMPEMADVLNAPANSNENARAPTKKQREKGF